MGPMAWVEFELQAAGVDGVALVRIGRAEERCVASVRVGTRVASGLGATAREALVAALMPFGQRLTTSLMAAPAMFGATAQVLAAAPSAWGD